MAGCSNNSMALVPAGHYSAGSRHFLCRCAINLQRPGHSEIKGSFYLWRLLAATRPLASGSRRGHAGSQAAWPYNPAKTSSSAMPSQTFMGRAQLSAERGTPRACLALLAQGVAAYSARVSTTIRPQSTAERKVILTTVGRDTTISPSALIVATHGTRARCTRANRASRPAAFALAIHGPTLAAPSVRHENDPPLEVGALDLHVEQTAADGHYAMARSLVEPPNQDTVPPRTSINSLTMTSAQRPVMSFMGRT